MVERLIQRRRVWDEGPRVVNHCQVGRSSSELTLPSEEDTAKFVPAAAVIRVCQALFGITGRKGRVGGLLSQL